jgi:uncharacterized protein YyaL (SSP411 family)
MPSGNSAAATLLLRLGHLTADAEMEEKGRRALAAFSALLERAPSGYMEMISAVDFLLGPTTEIVIAGAKDDPAVDALWREVNRRYLPNAVLAFHAGVDASPAHALIPYLEAQKPIGGRATAYVCSNYACRLPVHQVEELARDLDRIR